MDDQANYLRKEEVLKIVVSAVELATAGRTTRDLIENARQIQPATTERQKTRDCCQYIGLSSWSRVAMLLLLFTGAAIVREYLFSSGDDWPGLSLFRDRDLFKSLEGAWSMAGASSKDLNEGEADESVRKDEAELAELRKRLEDALVEIDTWKNKSENATKTKEGTEMEETVKKAESEVTELQKKLGEATLEINTLKNKAQLAPQKGVTTGSAYPAAAIAGKYLARAAHEQEAPDVVVPSVVKDPQTGKLRKILPEERAELLCSKVWTEYAAFHKLATADMRENGRTEPHRLAVFKKGRGMFGEGGGLGDVGSAHVTVLIFAMLTGRVFQEYWNHHEEVFYSPYINTTYTDKEEYLDLRPEREDNTWILSDDGRAVSSASQVPSAGGTYDMIVSSEMDEKGNLDRGRFNHTIEIFDTNKGITHLMWQNEVLAKHLTALGLNHETCYGCLSQFLLRPTDATRAMMQPLIDTLTEPDTFSISLHIRTDYSDSALQNGGSDEDTTVRFWQPFQCAQEIEETYLQKGVKVIWYLATDSKKLRDDAAKAFGSDPSKREVLFMPEPPRHIAQGYGTKEDGSGCSDWEWDCKNTEFVPNLMTTFVDWYMLSVADFHVITESGLGTTSAGRSMKTNTTFKVSNGEWPPSDLKPGDPLCKDGPSPWAHIEATRGAF